MPKKSENILHVRDESFSGQNSFRNPHNGGEGGGRPSAVPQYNCSPGTAMIFCQYSIANNKYSSLQLKRSVHSFKYRAMF